MDCGCLLRLRHVPLKDAPGTRAHHSRGLCNVCDIRHRSRGTLDDYPRTNRRTADVVEDWRELQAQGYSRRDAAARIGITLAALEKAIERDRKRAAS